ncbi:MAG: 15-cis-phytoene synthase [Shimia sp.]
MIDPKDMDHCREAIRHGSLSFHAASKLLPARVRDPALALYAFCRLADDAVDLGEEKAGAVLTLQERLDLAYEGRPRNTPTDRAFAAMVADHEMPRALPEALLEGLAWDAMGRRFQTLSEVVDYSARVAAAVGAMMTVLMGVRDPHALARACDLGVAMQLTNISRDVGEDARMGRIYLPLDWFADAGVEPAGFLADPLPSEPIRRMTRRLLREADRLYLRAQAGMPALPLSARPGIYAARYVYAGIGGQVRRNGFDNISRRAVTSKAQKFGWLGRAMLASGVSTVMPGPATLYAPPLPECAFLVDAAARPAASKRWTRPVAVLDTLAAIAAQERSAGQTSSVA